MTVRLQDDPRRLPEGAVLALGVKYQNSPRVFTYVFLKTERGWYGTGDSPQGAGWGAVEKWLNRDGRSMVWARLATEFADVATTTGAELIVQGQRATSVTMDDWDGQGVNPISGK